MDPASPQTGMLLSTAAVVFACVALILMRLLRPASDTDYLLIGAIATLASLVAVFLALNRTLFKTGEVFYKRRRG